MSLASKVCTFVVGMVGCTAVGVGYGLFGVEKTKSLATHPDDPKCEGGHRHCITDTGELHIDFFGVKQTKKST